MVERTHVQTRIGTLWQTVYAGYELYQPGMRVHEIEIHHAPACSLSQDRLADLAAIADEWMWETDEEDRFTYISGLPESLRDIRPGDLLDHPWRCVLEPSGNADNRRLYEQAMISRCSFRDVRFRLVAAGAQPRELACSGRPRFAEGHFIGFRGVARDITVEIEAELCAGQHRQQMIAALQQARDEAVEADRRKTRFLAAASHDLRQPLQALGLFVAALSARPHADDVRRIVDKLEISTEALENLLDTLLDISRVDAGAVEAHRVRFPLQHLFARLELEFAPLAASKELSLVFAPTDAVIFSDPALFERILRNLISNAIHYTGRGGIVVGCRRRADHWRIEVWDSGRGIAAADQQEIFREFHRLASRSDPRRGLGLGLTIVDRLTALLSHSIEVRSTLGKGSRFSVLVAETLRAKEAASCRGRIAERPQC